MAMTDKALQYVGVSRPDSFDDYFENWMSFGAWFRNIQSWWPHINDNNVLWLRYEEMVANLESCVERIVIFLGWTISENARSKILHNCSFDWMKQHDSKFATRFDNGASMFEPSKFIRKGKVGDHKNRLNPQQERRILERAEKDLPLECLQFIGLA